MLAQTRQPCLPWTLAFAVSVCVYPLSEVPEKDFLSFSILNEEVLLRLN